MLCFFFNSVRKLVFLFFPAHLKANSGEKIRTSVGVFFIFITEKRSRQMAERVRLGDTAAETPATTKSSVEDSVDEVLAMNAELKKRNDELMGQNALLQARVSELETGELEGLRTELAAEKREGARMMEFLKTIGEQARLEAQEKKQADERRKAEATVCAACGGFM
jgi:dynactin complex subunit